jgi:HlyD family secretion protein
LRARLDVDERDIGRIIIGAKTIVRASAFPGKDYPGTIVAIGRRMGRKNVRTDDPVERNDTKILEVVIALDATPPLVVGQRVTGYVLGKRE